MTGEQKLLVAVLAQAMEDMEDPSEAVRREAREWFCSPAVDSDEGYTYLRCCFALGLTSHRLRCLIGHPESRATIKETLRAWRNSQGQYAGGRNIGQRLRRRAA
jgi:hypothetical protein